MDQSTFSGTSGRGNPDLMSSDSIRYEYEHSILPYEDDASRWDGQELQPGHRVSIMIRVSQYA